MMTRGADRALVRELATEEDVQAVRLAFVDRQHVEDDDESRPKRACVLAGWIDIRHGVGRYELFGAGVKKPRCSPWTAWEDRVVAAIDRVLEEQMYLRRKVPLREIVLQGCVKTDCLLVVCAVDCMRSSEIYAEMQLRELSSGPRAGVMRACARLTKQGLDVVACDSFLQEHFDEIVRIFETNVCGRALCDYRVAFQLIQKH